MQALLWPIVSWIFRAIILKFIVMGIALVIVTELLPLAMSRIASFVSGTALSNAFLSIDPGVWYLLDFFALDVGVPLIVSAYVARFLIRRIPFVG